MTCPVILPVPDAIDNPISSVMVFPVFVFVLIEKVLVPFVKCEPWGINVTDSPSVILFDDDVYPVYPVISGVANVIVKVMVFVSLSGGTSLFVAVIVYDSFDKVVCDWGVTVISPLVLFKVI